MNLLQDLRFAARLMWKDRWFTTVAATALGIGYGGDGSIVGRSIKVNSLVSTVIGVMAPDMKFPFNGRGRFRAADRLRQCRQPPARALGAAFARNLR